jgi:hypothetical protein
MRAEESIHANCLLIGEIGLLVTGASGAGKSRFVLDVAARLGREPVRLIADDRVRLARMGGRLVARPVAGFLGRIELRGLGIADCLAMPSAVLRGIVSLTEETPERSPSQPFETQAFLGVDLPVLPLRSNVDSSATFVTRWPYFRDYISRR